MPALEVIDLCVDRGETRAVDGLSFSVEPGEILGLLGTNGAGKTSTVETMEGYLRPASGIVRVLGLDPHQNRTEVAPRIGVMPQGGGVHTAIRVGEAMRLYVGLYQAPARLGEQLLTQVGLAGFERRVWRTMSGGEQQRLSLALALVGEPEVAFLDEPTAGVDVGGRRLIHELVAELAKSGTAIVLTTHDLAEAERVCDRILILDAGKELASGTPAELTAGASDDLTFGADPGLDSAGLSAHLGTDVTETEPGRYRAGMEPTPAAVAALTSWMADHGVGLDDLHAGRQRLEDVFIRLTEETSAAAPEGAKPVGGAVVGDAVGADAAPTPDADGASGRPGLGRSGARRGRGPGHSGARPRRGRGGGRR